MKNRQLQFEFTVEYRHPVDALLFFAATCGLTVPEHVVRQARRICDEKGALGQPGNPE